MPLTMNPSNCRRRRFGRPLLTVALAAVVATLATAFAQGEGWVPGANGIEAFLAPTRVPQEGDMSYAGIYVFCDESAIDGLNLDLVLGYFDFFDDLPDEFTVWTRLDDGEVREYPFVLDVEWGDYGYPLYYEGVSEILQDLRVGGTLFVRAFLFAGRAADQQPTYVFESTGFADVEATLCLTSDPSPAPSDPFAAPSDPFAEPSDPFAAPSDPFAAPSDPSAAPSDPFAEPAKPVTPSAPALPSVSAPPAPSGNAAAGGTTTTAVKWAFLSTLDDGSPLYVADGGDVIVGLTCNGERVNLLVGIYGGPAMGATAVRLGLATYGLEPFSADIQRVVATSGRGDRGLTAAYGLELALRTADELPIQAQVGGTWIPLISVSGGPSFDKVWAALPCS